MQGLLNELHISADSLLANPWVVGLINVGIIIAAYVGLFIFGKPFIKRGIQKAVGGVQSESNEGVESAVFKILNRIAMLVGLSLIAHGLPIPPTLEIWVSNAVFVLTTLIVMSGLFDITDVVSRVLRANTPEFETLITKIAKILTVTLAVMVVMKHFNYDIWHIMTALGVGTLAVGLAAQPTLSNMIAGFTLLLDRPFRPGDRVQLTGGDLGDVVHIGIRSTRIQTPDGNMLFVSNSDLVNSRVINFSMPNGNLGYKVKFYFDQGADLREVKKILEACIKKIPGVIADSVKVLATNVTENALEVGAFFNVENFSQTSVVADLVIEAAIPELRSRQINFTTVPHSPSVSPRA